MPFVRVRGVDLHYEEFGSGGPTLLVAHGLMGSVALTARFGENLEEFAAKGLRVIAYDARGHGISGGTTRRADYHWDALGEDMHAVIAALGLAPVSVYGGSMGAGTALMCALEHPRDIDRLILRSPPPLGARAMRPARQWFGPLAVMYQSLGPRITSRMLAALPQMRQAQADNPANDMRSFFAVQRRQFIVPAIRGVIFDEPQLPVHRFDRVQQPALVMTHPGDRIHPLHSGELLHERLPHCRLAVAPTMTYWAENPGALPHVVASFVQGQEIASGLPREKVLHLHDRAGRHPAPPEADAADA